jgi:RNA polymerase sigma factor (sigma-70 family)
MAADPRTHPGPAGTRRRLSIEEARFYATVFDSARRGSLGELRRRGCGEEEAEEIFAAAFERTMAAVDPIAREFSEAQMVNYVKRACLRRLIKERRRRALRTEIKLGEIRSLSDPSKPGPEEITEERESVAIGREALQMLSERDQLIFRQRHQMDLRPEEIVRSTPGLSPRTYRKIIQRANSRVLKGFGRIRSGERCEEMRAGLLRRYVCEESSEAERRMVEAHLAHCRACRQAQARMRGYLADVAGPLLVIASSAEPGRDSVLGDVATRLLQLVPDAANALGEVGRGVRERVREALLRLAVGLPGAGTETTVGPALTASSVKLASACAGLAAGACITAGVLPGVGGIGLISDQSDAKQPAAKNAPHLSRGVGGGTAANTPLRGDTDSPVEKERNIKTGRKTSNATRQTAEPSTSAARSASPASNSASEARVSGRQTGTEVGAESGGQPLTTSPAPEPAKPSGGSRSGGTTQSRESTSPEHLDGSASEFGM